MDDSIKKSLNLPQTDFPMRASASLREQHLVARSTHQLYRWQKARNTIKPTTTSNQDDNLFILHDGPPYANGQLHIGHLLNKVLKDFMNRFALLQGRTVDYRPGWDCHGLPIELKALQTLPMAPNGDKPNPMEIRKHAKECALEAITSQRDDFWRWGVMADWEWDGQQNEDSTSTTTTTTTTPTRESTQGPLEAAENGSIYVTMAPKYEAAQLSVFRDMLLSGLVHRGLKPVHWSPSSKTALAEAELEYSDDHISESVYVTFPFSTLPKDTTVHDKIQQLVSNNALDVLIWTTTPWTLPANMALAVHPDVEYTVLESNTNQYILVASDLVEELQATLNSKANDENDSSSLDSSSLTLWTKTTLTCLGHELIGSNVTPPFGSEINTVVPIIPGDHVTTESGTGIVHTAPGHGQDDYIAWSNWHTHALAHASTKTAPLLCPVDDEGRYTTDIGILTNGTLNGLEGKSVVEIPKNHKNKNKNEKENKEELSVNVDIVERLNDRNLLLHHEAHSHRYPYDWRTKQPTIVRATTQWFVDLTHLKDAARESLLDVEMTPPVSRNRLESMVEGRDNWCISRQRTWGVPIPVFYKLNAEGKEDILATTESLNHIISVVEKYGTDSWFELPIEKLLPPSMSMDEKKSKTWYKGTDTLDVWFDSGCSWSARTNAMQEDTVFGNQIDRHRPADVYLEGSDQHRGWFQSSLLTHAASQYAANMLKKNGVVEKNAQNETNSMPSSYNAPYRKLVTHGFVLDEKGKKMSKSVGNVIDPSAIINGGISQSQIEIEEKEEQKEQEEDNNNNNNDENEEAGKKKKKKKKKKRKGPKPHKWSPYGADVLRLWAASSDYTRDVVIGPTVIAKASEQLRKIRNTARFILGNVSDFNVQTDAIIDINELSPIDRLFLHRTSIFLNDSKAHYSHFHFRKVIECLQQYVSNDLSSFYFEIVKDTLYTSGKTSKERRGVQTTLHHALGALLAVIGPIIPFTAEDIYQYQAIAVQKLGTDNQNNEVEII